MPKEERKEEIESETKFVWKLLYHIILTPLTIFMVLFKKKRAGDILRPFKDVLDFIVEPRFTITIILINTLIFLLSLFFSQGFFDSLVSFPSDILSGRFYTIFTAAFLHADISHLGFNMLALFLFGRVVERKLGKAKTAIIYFGALLTSGIFSSIINIMITKNNLGGVGASGAIMGLIAAAILIDPFYFTYELLLPMPVMVAGWLAILSDITGLITRASDGIGHLDHLGGFLSMTLLVFFLSGDDKHKMKKGLLINIISLIIFIFVYIFFLTGY